MSGRRRVLVADDDSEVRDLLVEYLTDRGFEVLQAENGLEALLCVKHEKPQAIVLDINMPRLGGLDALKRIHAFTPRTRVVVYSGSIEPEVERQAIAGGAVATRRRVHVPATIAIGAFGGLIVGMTSVGSGSLIIVMLMILYPDLTSGELVGTDLVQAIPLVGSAALGHLLFGDVAFGLTGALLIGGIPGIFIGSHVSAAAPDRVVRPTLFVVLAATGLKLTGAM